MTKNGKSRPPISKVIYKLECTLQQKYLPDELVVPADTISRLLNYISGLKEVNYVLLRKLQGHSTAEGKVPPKLSE